MRNAIGATAIAATAALLAYAFAPGLLAVYIAIVLVAGASALLYAPFVALIYLRRRRRARY